MLSHEPCLGGVVDLEPLRERERLGRLERLVERSDTVSIRLSIWLMS
jgi:hypothetical protein